MVSRFRSLAAQVFHSQRGDKYKCSPPGLLAVFDEAAFVGFFPHRKTRARGAPRFEHVRIRPRLGTQPFEQVENEILDGGVAHLSSSAMRALTSFLMIASGSGFVNGSWIASAVARSPLSSARSMEAGIGESLA